MSDVYVLFKQALAYQKDGGAKMYFCKGLALLPAELAAAALASGAAVRSNAQGEDLEEEK